MKKYLNLFIVSLMTILFSSCLESNLEELETYTGNDITSIQGVYYRYYSSETIPVSGEQVVSQTALTISNTNQDADAGVFDFTVSLPTDFPESEKGNVSSSELVVVVNLSAAAIIEPIGDAPALGAPGDWSKPNQYRVTAANGNEKVWTLTLNLEK